MLVFLRNVVICVKDVSMTNFINCSITSPLKIPSLHYSSKILEVSDQD